MKLGCIHAALLLQQRHAGLSSAEGLRLEEHLSGCASCRSEASLLAGLSQLSRQGFVPLRADARQRAMAGALAAVTRAEARPERRASRLGLPLMAAGTVAALAVALLMLRASPPRPEPLAAHAAPEPQSRVLAGEVTLSGTTRHVGQSLLAQAHMQTRAGAVVQLAHATVELRPETHAAWDAAQRRLELSQGSVMVEVDPQKHQSFAVGTAQFVVRVLGTRFEVTSDGVRLLRGRVSVQPSGASEAIVLDARDGEREYRVPRADAAEPPAPAPTPPPKAASAQPAPAPGRAAELLERARTQLSRRELSSARRSLKQALAAPNTPAERAEALSLQAESQLLAGHHAAARDGYLHIVAQLPREPAAETALYAAARIEAEHGEPKRARALLARYRERYPNGSFVREAERRERALAEPQP